MAAIGTAVVATTATGVATGTAIVTGAAAPWIFGALLTVGTIATGGALAVVGGIAALTATASGEEISNSDTSITVEGHFENDYSNFMGDLSSSNFGYSL